MDESSVEEIESQKVNLPDVKNKSVTTEETAAKQGHKSKEEWVANGGDPKEWHSAEVFIERGIWIQRHKAMQKQLDGT